MTTITLEVPDSLAAHQNDTIRFIAAKLHESGKLSLGRAADMASLSKRTFAELLSDYGVSRTELARTKLEIIKWMFISWIGQVAATFGFILLFLNR